MSARELLVRSWLVRRRDNACVSLASDSIGLSMSCLMQDNFMATSRRSAVQETSFNRVGVDIVSGVLFKGWMGYIGDARQKGRLSVTQGH